MASLRSPHYVLFFLLNCAVLASSSSISYNAFESNGWTGRALLQQKTSCPVSFENLNYTIITSQCKGPNYKTEPCCNAFLELACPYGEEINDEKNNCAATLFSYIHLYGKYPPGLFSSLCKGDKTGISCDEVNKRAGNSTNDKNWATTTATQSPLLIITVGFLLVFTLF